MSLNKIPEKAEESETSLKQCVDTINKCCHDEQMFPPSPWMPMTLLITTIWPLFLLFMSGRISFSNRTSPKKLVSITVFISSMDWHSMGPIRPIPALLTARGSQAWQDLLHKMCIFAEPIAPLAEVVWTYWECPPCAQAGCPRRLWWSPHHIRPAAWSPGSCPEPDPLPRPAPRPYWGSSWWRTLQPTHSTIHFGFCCSAPLKKRQLLNSKCSISSGSSVSVARDNLQTFTFAVLELSVFMLQHCVSICGVTDFTSTDVKTLSQTLVSGSAALLPSSHTTTVLLLYLWFAETFNTSILLWTRLLLFC